MSWTRTNDITHCCPLQPGVAEQDTFSVRTSRQATPTHHPRGRQGGWLGDGSRWDSPCTPLLPVLTALHSQRPRAQPAAISEQVTKKGDRPGLGQLQRESLPQTSAEMDSGGCIMYESSTPSHQPLHPINGHQDPHIGPCPTVIAG